MTSLSLSTVPASPEDDDQRQGISRSRADPGSRQGLRGEGGRAHGATHQPAQALLARAGDHQERPAALLRSRFALAHPAPGGTGDGDEALSQWLEWAVLL